jgi:prevent-host-death family protein
MSPFNIHQAKTHLSALIDRALAGEEVVIAKAGRPVVRLVPVEAETERRPGLAKGRLTPEFFEELPVEELAAWQNPK